MKDQEIRKGRFTYFLKYFNGMPITFRRNDETGAIELKIDEFSAIEGGFYKLYSAIQKLKQDRNKRPVWVRVDDWNY